MNLKKPGFHVITSERYKNISTDFPIKETSIIDLLIQIHRGKKTNIVLVHGLDSLLKDSTENALYETRKLLNEAINEMIVYEMSIIFLVKHNIDNIPDNPQIYKKPLAMVIPRPHDINFMEPGYLYYPII